MPKDVKEEPIKAPPKKPCIENHSPPHVANGSFHQSKVTDKEKKNAKYKDEKRACRNLFPSRFPWPLDDAKGKSCDMKGKVKGSKPLKIWKVKGSATPKLDPS